MFFLNQKFQSLEDVTITERKNINTTLNVKYIFILWVWTRIWLTYNGLQWRYLGLQGAYNFFLSL